MTIPPANDDRPVQGPHAEAEARRRSAWLKRYAMPHEAKIRRKLVRLGIAAEAVDDVIHDTYLRLLKSDDVDHIDNVPSYFFRAAKSVVLSEWRRRQCVHEQPHELSHFECIQSPHPPPDAVVDARLQLGRVAQAFADLSDRSREIVQLRRIDHLTGRETARQLGLSESCIEKRLAAALQSLGRAATPWNPDYQDV